MKMNKLLFPLILFCSLGSWIPAKGNVDVTTMDNLKLQLSQAKTVEDSVSALYNLFDASIGDKKSRPAWELIDIAKRHNLQDVLIDIIPQLAVIIMHDDKALKNLMIESEFIQNANRRKAVKVFIQIEKATHEANYIPANERKKVLLKYAKADLKTTGDYYQDLLDLYRVVIFMRTFTESSLYQEYLTRLEEMIEKLPPEDYQIRNMFYTTAANTHSDKKNHEKALKADSLLLGIIEDLEIKHSDAHRDYRNYNRYRYIAYRRMMSNYPALSEAQMRDLYAKCEELAEKDIEVAVDMQSSSQPLIYLLMKEGKYAEAVQKIKQSIEWEKRKKNISLKSHKKLIRMLVEAADSINDTSTLANSAIEFNKLLLQDLKSQSEESYNELQVRYEVNNLRNENEKLEIDKRDTEIATSQKVVSLILGALLVLVVMLMILYKNHFFLRQKTRELRAENERLHLYIETLINDGKPTGSAELKKRQENND